MKLLYYPFLRTYMTLMQHEVEPAPMNFQALAARIIQGHPLNQDQIESIVRCPVERLDDLLASARKIKDHFFGQTVQLCAIINAKSGRCSEDCSFCAQSSHYRTESPAFSLVDRETMLTSACRAREAGATRFSLVTSGKKPGKEDLERMAGYIADIRDLGLLPDISPGILSREEMLYLKKSGLSGYHHNLETSRSFFPSICTTHDYEEDVAAVQEAVGLELYVCSGGIFGLGESWKDRFELAMTLQELNVQSVPLNFLHPIPGTPLQDRPLLEPDEALRIIALYRFLLPDRHLRICGGRETVFGLSRKKEVFLAGGSGLMIGDYLTVKGSSVLSDREDIRALGLKIDDLQSF